MDQVNNPQTSDNSWHSLYKISGFAALAAGIFFRRNLAAEVDLFVESEAPVAVIDWFSLLQSNRLLALTYLNIFDVLNYVLLALMFFALYVILRRVNKSWMTIAVGLAFVGIGVYLATNTALSMLALSVRFSVAATEAQIAQLLAAGESLLALNRFSLPGSQPGSGGFASLLLIATAEMITGVIMLRSGIFKRFTAIIGILAGGFDLAYCLGYIFLPGVDSEVLALIFIPAAGFFLMIWHILLGLKIYKLGKTRVWG